jgi:hypothetical protein
MSSRDRLWSQQFNHQQLQMFMPAGELRNRIVDYPDDPGEDAIQRSLIESRVRRISPGQSENLGVKEGSTLYESIHDEGVKEPVELLFTNRQGDIWPAENLEAARRDRRPILVEGHHRAASAMDIDPTMEVPVTYDE